MTHPHAWTPERVERLKSLWAQGWSCSQIASDLRGITRNAVIGKVGRLKLPKRATVARPVRAYTGPKVVRLARRPAARIVKPAPPELPPPPPAAPAVVAPSLGVSLLALASGACHWPDADGATFCGHPATPGKPYCAGHCAVAYTKPKKPPYAPRPRSRPHKAGEFFDRFDIAA